MSTIKRFIQRTIEALIPDQTVPGDTFLRGFSPSVQVDRYSCGIQVVRSILDYYGRETDESELCSRIDSDGTSTATMKAMFREHNLRCISKKKIWWRGIVSSIKRGAPLVVCLDDGEHWSVVFGYNRSWLEVLVMDPLLTSMFGQRVDYESLKERWDGWGMAVVDR